ncbi:MAG: hypothetical protein II453_07105 [Alphaproteobacteria bacterium]|nr:hypothetical protein [Alphaproteobacteria bacterium]
MKEKKVTRRKRAQKAADIFTPAVLKEIFSKMEVGVSLKKACESLGLARSSFITYIDKDPALYEQYARAQKIGQDYQFETLDEYARESKDDPYTKKLYIDVLKWKLAKQQPKKYGDKLEVEGKNIAPTTIIIKRADE